MRVCVYTYIYIYIYNIGKRHGRGTWQTKIWTYRPVESRDVENWRHDLMHGVCIVEDPDYV